MAKTRQTMWHRTRQGSAIIVAISLASAYGLVSLAIDRGSIFAYLAAIGLVVLVVNRLSHILRVSLGKTQDGLK